MPKQSRRDKAILKLGARLLEAPAFALDTMHLPLIQKQQNKLINSLYKSSNLMRELAGEKRKKFKRVMEGNRIVEVT